MSNGLSRATVLKGIAAVAAGAVIFAGLQNVEYDPTAPRIKRNYTAGTYAASAQGFGELTLFATFDDSSITDIVLDTSNETPSIGGAAAEELISQCLAAQDYEIDGVAGATLTSTGVREALADCIAQATGEIPARELPEMKEPEAEEAPAAGQQENAAEATEVPGAYIPGVYTANAQGFGEVKIQVTFDEESITAVDADTSGETPEIGGAAAEELIAQVLEAQSADIDGVAGATLTSDAFRAGVSDCMQQAAGQTSADETAEPVSYIPGEYEASAQGFGEVKMTATVDENGLASVSLDTSNETPEIGGAAAEELTAQVLEAQSADIDGVAGATLTSDAVRACVEDILGQAAGVTEGTGDSEEEKAEPEASEEEKAEPEASEEEKTEPEASEEEKTEPEASEEEKTEPEAVMSEVTGFVPGEYEAVAQGFGEVKMTAKVDENGISDIKLDTSNETPEIGGAATEELIAQVLEAQSADIDGVSGATLTTNAVKACVEVILEQAEPAEEPAEEVKASEEEKDEADASEEKNDEAKAAEEEKEGESEEATDEELTGFVPGEYEAAAQGFGEVKMTATVDENGITDIELDTSEETPAIGGAAAEELIAQVLEAQSAEIDGVSGATLTTDAVKACVEDVLEQAAAKAEESEAPAEEEEEKAEAPAEEEEEAAEASAEEEEEKAEAPAEEKEEKEAEAPAEEKEEKEEPEEGTVGYIPGEYTAKAQGYGEVTMTAEFNEERIVSIGLDVSNETSSIGGAASKKLIRQCLREQSPEIDGVSGATLTTNAVKECLADCISQASARD